MDCCMGCCTDHCVDRRHMRHSLEPKDRLAVGVVYKPARQGSGFGYHKTLETEGYQYQNDEIFAEYYVPLG